MKISKTKIRSILSELPLILLLVVCFFLTQTYFGTNNYTLLNKIYVMLVFLIGVVLVVKNKGVLRVNKNEKYLYGMLVIPYCLIFIYSLLLVFFVHAISVSSLISSMRLVILMPVIAILVYYSYQAQIVDAIFYAAFINYVFYIAAFIKTYGLGGMLKFIALTDMAGVGNRPLEAHEITFIFGILILYYMLTYKKENRIKLIVSIVCCILGFKRILIAGLLVASVVFWILKKQSAKPKALIKFVSVCCFVFCVIWILISSTDLLVNLSDRLNIELNGRSNIIKILDGHYELSLFYIGKGNGYVRDVMQAFVFARGFGTTGFHNDILKYYIDLGCIPSLLFFWNVTYWNTKRLQSRFSEKAAISYIVLMVCVILCWATDNLASYPNFLLVFNIIIIALIKKSGGFEFHRQ